MGLTNCIFPGLGVVIMAVAFIFYVVSNAVPLWGKIETSGTSVEIGLWRSCASRQGQRECGNPDICEIVDKCDKLRAARAFVTIACLLSAFATLIFLLQTIMQNTMQKAIAFLSLGLSILSLLAGTIGVAVGGHLVTEDFKFTFAAAAIVGVIAIIINFVGVITGILATATSRKD